MFTFILKRVFQAIPVLFVVVTATFFLIHSAPGGPFDAEKEIPPQILENLLKAYNLDAPVHEQYFIYLSNLVKGDFGPSFKYTDYSVTEMISSGFMVTLELGFYALIVALVIGLATGIFASLRPNTLGDYIPMSISMLGICMPAFLLGPLLVLTFSIWLGWLPVAGWGQFPGDKILPSITLGAAYAAYVARLTRGGMLEVLSQDFIRTARAKGLSERVVVLKHALRGGVLPVVSFLGPAIAGLITGSFVVETLFQIPGLGRFYVQAAFNRDYTMILGSTIFYSSLIISMNIISDILTVWLNPRLDYDNKATT
ncbi:MAG: ABC transporter [Gammaproteobacteria bacterium]|nr:MAG: ABC transporter [Gammaproteobacteria bacterium]